MGNEVSSATDIYRTGSTANNIIQSSYSPPPSRTMTGRRTSSKSLIRTGSLRSALSRTSSLRSMNSGNSHTYNDLNKKLHRLQDGAPCRTDKDRKERYKSRLEEYEMKKIERNERIRNMEQKWEEQYFASQNTSWWKKCLCCCG